MGSLNFEISCCWAGCHQIARWNAELHSKSPTDIIEWALTQDQRAIVSTNFAPYAAVLLHLCVRVKRDIPVVWVDHGYNRPATYRHAEALKKLLNLNLKVYLPTLTAAHRNAIYGDLPSATDHADLMQFSMLMKLEPFQRAVKELAPKVWIAAVRRVQNGNRASLDIVSPDANFGTLKVSPVFYWTDAEMESYLSQNKLPNERDYVDPSKADGKHECGLHVAGRVNRILYETTP